jgi:hypothetical protein
LNSKSPWFESFYWSLKFLGFKLKIYIFGKRLDFGLNFKTPFENSKISISPFSYFSAQFSLFWARSLQQPSLFILFFFFLLPRRPRSSPAQPSPVMQPTHMRPTRPSSSSYSKTSCRHIPGVPLSVAAPRRHSLSHATIS